MTNKIWHAPEYFAANPGMRRRIMVDSICSQVNTWAEKVRKVLLPVILWASLLHPNWTNAQQLDISTGCIGINDREQWEVFICDNELVEKYNTILNEARQEVIDAEGFLYFIDTFGPVLEYLDTFWLDSWDIISAMSLYIAHLNRDTNYIEFTIRYLDFLDWYSNPEIQLEAMLRQQWIYLN